MDQQTIHRYTDVAQFSVESLFKLFVQAELRLEAVWGRLNTDTAVLQGFYL